VENDPFKQRRGQSSLVLGLTLAFGLLVAAGAIFRGDIKSAWILWQVRRLEQADDPAALAERLDSCMAVVPAGGFWMGEDEMNLDERPQSWITLSGFQIDRFEVTNAQYRRFLADSGYPPPPYWNGLDYPTGQSAMPVVGVSWDQALAYCEWRGKRLPTEAEWEKACRGTDGRLYPWGNSWQPGRVNLGLEYTSSWPIEIEQGWQLLQLSSVGINTPRLLPVGSYWQGRSVYGVFDLVGNASEWVADWYTWNGYQDIPSENPVGLGPPWNRSLRGSGWFDRLGTDPLASRLSRCSQRNSSHSHDDPRLGFRCAQSN
jgi:formylglycine-generating enzyme required for sulfatase activity